MSYWIDAHSHMNDECYRNDFESYMDNAMKNEVVRTNVICMNREDLLYTQILKMSHQNLDISFGYYPEDVNQITEEDLEFLDEVADTVSIIGEIGLDYHNGKQDAEKQKELFIKQIEIANKHGLPIMIHSRDAAQDTFDILKKYAKTNVALHCYSDSLELMNEYLKLGYYISFTGVVTFKNANQPVINAKNCPLDRMLIETDCPYLTPVPYRGQQNETAYVKHTGEFIANLKNVDVELFKEQIAKNYGNFKKRKHEEN